MEHYATAPDSPMFMRADPLLTERLLRHLIARGDSWALAGHLRTDGVYSNA